MDHNKGSINNYIEFSDESLLSEDAIKEMKKRIPDDLLDKKAKEISDRAIEERWPIERLNQEISKVIKELSEL